MEPTTTEDVVPELLPIFSFLNSHANKLYQEGYFLKLEDQNTRMSKHRRHHLPHLSLTHALPKL